MQKISIITVNRNHAEGLEKTIHSVSRQTYGPVEYIVVDGASDDGSVDVIKKYQKHINIWTSEPDTGIYNAMNKGGRKASGDYLLFLNSGDHLYSDHSLAELMDQKPDADIVYTNQYRFGEKGERITQFPEKLTFYWLYTEYLPHNCMLIKRSLFETVGGYRENFHIVSDWLFYLLAIAKHNCSCQHYKMILSAMEDGGVSNSVDFSKKVSKERYEAMTEDFPLFVEDYAALYNYRHNSAFKIVKRAVKKILPF